MKTQFLTSLEKRGLTTKTASSLSGIPYQTLYQYASGLRKIGAEAALKIENALGIPRHELRPDLWAPAEEAND